MNNKKEYYLNNITEKHVNALHHPIYIISNEVNTTPTKLAPEVW